MLSPPLSPLEELTRFSNLAFPKGVDGFLWQPRAAPQHFPAWQSALASFMELAPVTRTLRMASASFFSSQPGGGLEHPGGSNHPLRGGIWLQHHPKFAAARGCGMTPSLLQEMSGSPALLPKLDINVQ